MTLRKRLLEPIRRVQASAAAAYQQRVLLSRAKRTVHSGLRRVLATPPEVTIELDDTIAYAHDAILKRDGRRVLVTMSPHNLPLTVEYGSARLPAYIYWLAHCRDDVERITVTLSDGDRASGAVFSPCTFFPDVVAIPDPIFFISQGYRRERHASLSSGTSWDDRSNELVWRGGMHSFDSFDLHVAACRPALAAQRLTACLELRNTPGTDVKLVKPSPPETHVTTYERVGIAGERVPQQSWLGRKYALDVDGYSNAWSNFFTRLLFGCCVMKIASRHAYRQWYYDRIKPWEHFVPVAADCSDIREKLAWMRDHDDACREIADRGRAFAMALTFEAANTDAVALIEANWQRHRD